MAQLELRGIQKSFGSVNVILFDIPGAGPHVIDVTSALPVITNPVIIDGTSEPDYVGGPIVQLDGNNAVARDAEAQS